MLISPLASADCAISFDNGAQLLLPVARTAAEQIRGLSLQSDPVPGLVFVWPQPDIRIVWMKNTPASLSAAWVGVDGIVQSVQDMEPETLTQHSSLRPAVAVIEVPKGRFSQLGIGRGSRVTAAGCIPLQASSQPAT
ncbi:TPA: DUF192 domain-containing protein [Pseudomonas putida]